MRKIIPLCVIVMSAGLLSGCALKSNQNTNTAVPQSNNNSSGDTSADYTINQGEAVLFWGKGCPHCENVQKFIENNPQLAEKQKIRQIEVFEDLKGQKIFLEKVSECQLSQAGVPILYIDGKCYQGDVPTINELKTFL